MSSRTWALECVHSGMAPFPTVSVQVMAMKGEQGSLLVKGHSCGFKVVQDDGRSCNEEKD